MDAPNMRVPGRKRRAFSLVELLVVVAVVAILLAIMLPALGKMREHSRSAKCLSNLKQLGTALHTYMLDYNDYTPPRAITYAKASGLSFKGYRDDEGVAWSDQIVLGQYAGSTNGNNSSPEFKFTSVRARSAFICPSDRYHDQSALMHVSYGMGTNFAFLDAKSAYSKLWKASKIREPGKELVLVDSSEYVFQPGGWTEPFPFYGTSDDVGPDQRNWDPGNPLSRYNWSRRHFGGGANVLFLDGAVRAFDDLKPAYDKKEIYVHQE
jgi:prepilin-type N-terminal cleavage/methylation domain-containing protein/prepilin-type processing-associated H-X9-DG protein